MFKLVLILKYLRRKLAPLFAALAVTLCTAMVIIVISVMGGFLDTLRDSARQLTGDVIVDDGGSLIGFAHYEALTERLEQLDQVEAAAAVVRSYALLNVELPGQHFSKPVEVQGIDPQQYDRIVGYRDTLLWQQRDQQDRLRAMTFEAPELPWAQNPELPGVVPGIEVMPRPRDEQGQYDPDHAPIGVTFHLTLMPLTERGAMASETPVSQSFRVVDEFQSGLHDVDANRLFVPMDVLQRRLDMHAQQVWTEFDEWGEPIGESVERPARATEVLARGAPGYALSEVHAAVQQATRDFAMDQPNVQPLRVRTWEQQHGMLLAAVQNETGLVTFLFVVISVVAIVMVATTFYMIVLEKTRDIGILRAIGAGSGGIMNIFLGYGLAVGVVGALLGLVLACLVVTNLNDLQWALANRLGTFALWGGLVLLGAVLGAIVGTLIGRRRDVPFEAGTAGGLAGALAVFITAWFAFDAISQGPIAQFNATYGWQMWHPELYYFDRIPDTVDPINAALIVLGATASAVVGALIPALIAGRQNPIEALRHE